MPRANLICAAVRPSGRMVSVVIGQASKQGSDVVLSASSYVQAYGRIELTVPTRQGAKQQRSIGRLDPHMATNRHTASLYMTSDLLN